jgi:hypothetical protein
MAATTRPTWTVVEPKTKPALRAAAFPVSRFVTSSNTFGSLAS